MTAMMMTMKAIDANVVYEFLVHLVFWCSIATLFLTGLQKSVEKFYPGGQFAKAIAFITDLVSQYGALNLRDKIATIGGAPARRAEDKSVPPAS